MPKYYAVEEERYWRSNGKIFHIYTYYFETNITCYENVVFHQGVPSREGAFRKQKKGMIDMEIVNSNGQSKF